MSPNRNDVRRRRLHAVEALGHFKIVAQEHFDGIPLGPCMDVRRGQLPKAIGFVGVCRFADVFGRQNVGGLFGK